MFEVVAKMNRNGDIDSRIDNFWNLIEQQLCVIFPKYLRNILRLRGYDSAGSIKFITSEDIRNFETFAKTSMIDRLAANFNREDYFSIYAGPEDFEIIPGHKILLEGVVQHIKEMTEKHGNNYFNFYESVDSSSQPFINKRASQRSTKLNDKMTLPKAFSSSEENETGNEKESYIKQEQLNLIKKVKAWLGKKADTMSRKYSNEIHERTVIMSVKTVGQIQKLCAHIKCFVCDEPIKMSEIRKVLVDYSLETYLSASNFYFHIQLHQKKCEMNIRRLNTIENSDDDESSCNTFSRETGSKRPSKKGLKSALQPTNILNRFLEQSRGNTPSNNHPKVKHPPHTVTTQGNDKKGGCETPFLWNVDEEVELDKTNNTPSDNFSSQEYKKKIKPSTNRELEEPGSYPKNTIVLDRFRGQSSGNTSLCNRPKVKHPPHTVTTQVNNKKSCKRSFLWTVDEDAEFESDKTDTRSACVKFIKSKPADSPETCEEISPATNDNEIIDLAEETDNDFSVEALPYQNTSKAFSQSNSYIKNGKNNDFEIEEFKVNNKYWSTRSEGASTGHQFHQARPTKCAHQKAEKTGRGLETPASTFRVHGEEKVKRCSEDESDAENTVVNKGISNVIHKKANNKIRSSNNKNKENFRNEGGTSSKKIIQINSSSKTKKKKFVDKEGEKRDLARKSVLLEKKGHDLQTTNDERKAKAQTKRSMNIQNDKELDDKSSEDSDLNENFGLDATTKMTKRRKKHRNSLYNAMKDKGKMAQTFHEETEDLQCSKPKKMKSCPKGNHN